MFFNNGMSNKQYKSVCQEKKRVTIGFFEPLMIPSRHENIPHPSYPVPSWLWDLIEMNPMGTGSEWKTDFLGTFGNS